MKRFLTGLVFVLALAPAATAHGDAGVLELVEAERVGNNEVRYVVRLTYANDGDPATGREVHALIGTEEVATPMASQGDGLYQATVVFPTAGEYPVRFRVDDPEATLDHVEQLVESTTTSTIDSSDIDNDAPNVADEPLLEEEEDGGSTWLLVLMAIIVAVMVVVAAAFVRGRRPPE